MAIFDFREIKCGFEGREITYVYAICTIGFEEGEEVLEIPKEWNGKPITHIGYFQDKRMGYERYHDWHHPSQGFDEYVPTEYFPSECSFQTIPKGIKKIIIPATATNISSCFFDKEINAVYTIDGENDHFAVKDGKLIRKKRT